jgi:hypothetical protein
MTQEPLETSMTRFRPLITLVLLTLVALPVSAATSPIKTVEIGLFLIDISTIDERLENFTCEFDVITRWRDPALAFTPVEGEDIPRLFTGAQALLVMENGWDPEIFAVNVLDRSDMGRPRVLLFPDGTITTRNRLRRTLRAQLDFHEFPFDSQVLAVMLLKDAAHFIFPADQEHLTLLDKALVDRIDGPLHNGVRSIITAHGINGNTDHISSYLTVIMSTGSMINPY